MQTVQVRGLSELSQRLRALPEKIARNALRSGVNAGARIIRDAYKGKINNRTGTLRRAAVTKFIREESNDQQATYYVVPRKGKKLRRTGKRGQNLSADAYYASWVEFGHRIVSRRGKVSGWTIRSRRSSATGTVPARRWLTQAYEQNKERSLTAIQNKITDNLSKLSEFR